MAYRIKTGSKGSPTTSTSDSLITKSDILSMISSGMKGTDFYELEPVEVLEVLQGDNIPDNYKVELSDGKKVEDYAYVGAIKGRYCYSRQGEEKGFDYFKPLNPNMYALPAQHEIVIGIEFMGKKFYTSILNIFGNNNFNQVPNISYLKKKNPTPMDPDGKLKRDDKARRVMPFMGDVIFEGRFKNHIRLGSNVRNDKEESPNIQLVVGHLMNGDSDPDESKWRDKELKKQLEEPFLDDPDKKNTREKPLKSDIDKDAGSIYLTTDEDLYVTPPFKSKHEDALPPFTDKNILLNGDRIIFNSQNESSIVIASSKDLVASVKNEVLIETPKMTIGAKDADEPLVLGNKLVEAFEAIIGILEGGLVGASAVAPTPVGLGLIDQLRGLLMTDGDTGFLSKEHRIINNKKAGTWKTEHPDE
tara:strand:+ start:1677 stop:2927 length:1251 start_codon:yes stop_codon:yes gene_type:complete